ncbi:phospholipase [Prauserella marina]|uniref:Phospholipase/carboxylesterase n=1 Tax=Prauserella marina TaxID=530584 RepID=A0A222VWJ1_9PSEU|nr:alpha/beta hydrolase [Prauserella marina]ASR38288.1 phospholipase [Prauserella marina]PWV78510.1 phospholipase/carboxylesterase [Prauserella marina]SDC87598.1 phospholipase/carboxylesterase [Prauserella marina]
MTTLSLDHRFVEGDEDAPVLLLLHGTGSGPDDILALGRELSPSSPMLAPAGPVSENGAARWFRRLAEGVFDTDDVVVRAGQLADFVLAAGEEYGFAGRRLVAAGFSNGANIAAAVTLLRPDALKEAMLFAAMSPVPDPPTFDLSATRVFLSNGTRDPMAPAASSRNLVSMLRQRSADVTEDWHEGGHQITRAGLVAAKSWLG